MNIGRIAVTTIREFKSNLLKEELINKAKSIANELKLKYIDRENYSVENIIDKYSIQQLLIVEKERLIIKSKDNELFWHPNMSELKIKSIKNGNKENIVEATKLKNGDSILDCTLGLGGDAIILSSMVGEQGKVVGTEINKYICYLTKEGLINYRNVSEEVKDAMARIKVVNESYEKYLIKQSDNTFDVVYFDPMFKNPNKKSASLNSFRNLAEHKGISEEIIREAVRVCKKRVVIKERRGFNDFEKLGVNKIYGGKKDGAIIYGVIEKDEVYNL